MFLEVSFIVDGATEKVYNFYTPVSKVLVKPAPNTIFYINQRLLQS